MEGCSRLRCGPGHEHIKRASERPFGIQGGMTNSGGEGGVFCDLLAGWTFTGVPPTAQPTEPTNRSTGACTKSPLIQPHSWSIPSGCPLFPACGQPLRDRDRCLWGKRRGANWGRQGYCWGWVCRIQATGSALDAFDAFVAFVSHLQMSGDWMGTVRKGG